MDQNHALNMDRRQLIGAGAALLATGLNGVAQAAAARRWGLQVFTVLAPLELDFEGTLKAVAAMGYKEVETIGGFGRDPAYVRDTLKRFGLASPSQHAAPKALYASFAAWSKREITTEQNRANYIAAFEPERADALIDDAVKTAKALGQQYVIWPILLPQQLASRAVLDRYIAIFNRAGATCAREGLTFAFHNHDREFARLDGEVIYDIILANTDAATVKMEMDFYWINKAKADPFAYLAKHKNRFKAVHVKDMAKDEPEPCPSPGWSRPPMGQG